MSPCDKLTNRHLKRSVTGFIPNYIIIRQRSGERINDGIKYAITTEDGKTRADNDGPQG